MLNLSFLFEKFDYWLRRKQPNFERHKSNLEVRMRLDMQHTYSNI